MNKVALACAAFAVAQQFIAFTPIPPPGSVTVNTLASSATVVVNRKIIYQSQFHVPQKVISTTPQGWEFAQPTVRTGPILNAAQQQFEAFAPEGTIISKTPLGWMVQWPDLFTMARSGGPSRPIGAELQQFQSFAPRGAIISTTPIGWLFQQPILFAPSVNASQQQFSSFAPAGIILSVTPQGNRAQWPELFWLGKSYGPSNPVSPEQQQFSTYPPQGSVPTVFTFQSFIQLELVTRKPVLLGDFARATPPVAAAVTPITSGVQPWEPPQFFKGYPSTKFPDFASGIVALFNPNNTIDVASSGGGTIVFNRSVIYQSNFRSPQFVAPVAIPLPMAEFPARLGPYPICVITDFAGAASSPFVIDGNQPGWEPLPYRFPVQQPFSNYAPFIPTVANTVTWSTNQWPDLFVNSRSLGPSRPLSVEQQQFATYPVRGNVPTVTPPTEWSESPQAYVQPYRASLQQFQAFAPLGTITFTSTPSALSFTTSPDPTHPPKLPAWEQQFQALAPLGTIVSVTPQGWYGQWPDVWKYRSFPLPEGIVNVNNVTTAAVAQSCVFGPFDISARKQAVQADNWSSGQRPSQQVYVAFPPFETVAKPKAFILDVQAFTQPTVAPQAAFGSLGWWDAISAQKRLVAFLSPVTSLPPFVPIPPAVTPGRFFAVEWPYSVKRPLWPSLMDFGLFEGQVIIPATRIVGHPHLTGYKYAITLIGTKQPPNLLGEVD